MSNLIRREDAIDALKKIMFTHIFECGEYIGEDTREFSIMNAKKALDVIETLPSVELETITIEEVSNQLGCATIQSALYWFEFLKTLDSLGFAIVRKKTI